MSIQISKMALFRSHKQVRAAEILSAIRVANNDRVVTFVDPSIEAITVPAEVFSRYVPVKGDFLVVYPDGYQSISPRKTFLEGYSEVTA